MPSGRRRDSMSLVRDDIDVVLIPKIESGMDFENRTQEVQEIIRKMILLAGKRGRPSKKEEEYEEAA